jgi:urease accessory protein UreF
MAKPTLLQKIGTWSFIGGCLIALAAGIWDLSPVIISILIILGLIVGFLNVTGEETTAFLLATVSLVIVAAVGADVLGQVDVIGPTLERVLVTFITFVIPATIIVACKAIYSLAAD